MYSFFLKKKKNILPSVKLVYQGTQKMGHTVFKILDTAFSIKTEIYLIVENLNDC